MLVFFSLDKNQAIIQFPDGPYKETCLSEKKIRFPYLNNILAKFPLGF